VKVEYHPGDICDENSTPSRQGTWRMSTTSWLRGEVKMSTSPCSSADRRRLARLHERV